MNFSWEKLDLLMDLKTLLLLVGKNSESLDIGLNFDFKASKEISGMSLSNIKKKVKQLSEKVNITEIKSNLDKFLD